MNYNGTSTMPGQPVESATNQYVIVGNNTIYGGGTASMPGTPITPPTNQYVMVGSNMTTATGVVTPPHHQQVIQL